MWQHDERIIIHSKSPYEITEGPLIQILNSLKQCWRVYKDGSHLAGLIDLILSQSNDPYDTGLKLVYSSGDFFTGKAVTLSSAIARGLERFTATNPQQVILFEMKRQALKLSLEQASVQLRVYLCQSFKMIEDKAGFVDVIDELVGKQLYKDACQVCSMLNLQNFFSVETFLVPLLLQDKVQIVEDYVNQAPKEIQENFIKYLDQIVVDSRAKDDLISRLSVDQARLDKLAPKQLSKLIIRLLRKFNFPESLAPNTVLKRQRSGLHYLMYQRNCGIAKGSQAWTEMLFDTVKDVPELQRELVCNLSEMGWLQEARDFFKRFGFTDDGKWPRVLFEGECTGSFDQGNSGKFDFLKISLPEDAITVVNHQQGFNDFTKTMSKVDLIAMDCEWKPSFGVQQNQLSLVQIATESAVFLLDIPALLANVPDFSAKLSSIMFKQQLCKIGFGIQCDLALLKTTLACPKSQKIGLIDLQPLLKHLSQAGLKFPYSESSFDTLSLSEATSMILGASLDKSEQFSNWDLRPLRSEQIKYAALDAYCLILIWNVIKEECLRQKIIFEEILEKFAVNAKSTSKQLKASEVQFVCSEELSSLVTCMRSYGISSYLLKKDLTKGQVKKFRESTALVVNNDLPDSRLNRLEIFRVANDNPKNQLIALLLFFHVDIDEDNLRPRCLACNECDLREIYPDTIRELKIYEETRNKLLSYHRPAEEIDSENSEDDFDEDNCSGYYENRQTDTEETLTDQKYRTRFGVLIQTRNVPEHWLEEFELFLLCESCGHIQIFHQVRNLSQLVFSSS